MKPNPGSQTRDDSLLAARILFLLRRDLKDCQICKCVRINKLGFRGLMNLFRFFLSSSGLLYFAQDAQDAQVAHWMCQCAIYAQDLRTILSHCAIYAQDCTYSPMRNICARFAQDCTSFPMRNIRARFAQDCTSFPNAQYMHKICARLYLFLQCAIYAQDLHKIVLLSPMRNICTRLYFSSQCTTSSHNLCTKHHHSAGHKIFYFLIQIDRSNHKYNEDKKMKSDVIFFQLLRTYLKY